MERPFHLARGNFKIDITNGFETAVADRDFLQWTGKLWFVMGGVCGGHRLMVMVRGRETGGGRMDWESDDAEIGWGAHVATRAGSEQGLVQDQKPPARTGCRRRVSFWASNALIGKIIN